jgi:thiosulfate/3-mercaptopyruvate sulfurtransferase
MAMLDVGGPEHVGGRLPPFVPLAAVEGLERPRLVDLRWSLDGSVGRENWLAGHLPGAVFADLDADLAGPPDAIGGRHPLPTPEAFAASMRRLGVDRGQPVVAMDTAGGAVAARLVWMLRILDHPAAVLDPGDVTPDVLVEQGPVPVRQGSFRARPWPSEALATTAEIEALAAGGRLVDARDEERFRGEHEPVDPRPGHVPGARNLPWRHNLVDGRLRSASDLRLRYEAMGVDADAVVHCGSGVTACHHALALEHAGLGRPRVWVGSWSAWSSDPGRAVVTGP